MSEKNRAEKCVNCGGSEIERLAKNKYKCRHCSSVFETVVPRVFIAPGADVTFGNNVSINQGLEIESGAKVKFTGKVKIDEEGIHT